MDMKKSSKGFTLIELLVSLSIISLVLFSFFTIVNTSIKSNTKNEKDIKAMNLAQSEVENLRLQLKSDTEEFTSTKGSKIILNKGKDSQQTIDYVFIDSSNKQESDKYKVVIELKNITGNESLYNVVVDVKPVNKKLSKKEIKIITQISGKSR